MNYTAEISEIDHLRRELVKTQEKLKHTELVFDNIIQSTSIGYWDWNLSNGYIYFSSAFKRMLGYNDNELPNDSITWQIITLPGDQPLSLDFIKKNIDPDEAHSFCFEAKFHQKNGNIIWVHCKGQITAWGNDGQPSRIVGSHRDITLLKEAEQTKQYAKVLEVKNKELEQFAYVASHDLQEPLRNISSLIELLNYQKSNSIDANTEKYFTYITEASDRMKHLVKALLDYSRLGRNKEFARFDCNEVINEIIQDISGRINKTNTTIEIDELPVLYAFRNEFKMLLYNLIDNAIKFSRKDEDPEIQIWATCEQKFCKFAISDNGIGIDSQYSEKIFSFFQRLHTRTEFNGAGIGLAHCKKIVEMHGGRIWYESTPNHGSTFYFTIPIQT